ncbi:hypothetical protein LTR72_012596, partial [Exophiala xenobiotica]
MPSPKPTRPKTTSYPSTPSTLDSPTAKTSRATPYGRFKNRTAQSPDSDVCKDLLLGDSRTPHCNLSSKSARPRFCAYTCYMPLAGVTTEDLQKKKAAFE